MNALLAPTSQTAAPVAETTAWPLWAVLMSLPWLVPVHMQPWTSFHTDAAMACAATPAMLWALWASQRRIVVPVEAAVIALLATVPPLQWVMGLIVFGGDAWLAALYLLGVAAAIIVGSAAQRCRPWALASALFASFGMAAMASLLLALHQWLQIDLLGSALFVLPAGARPAANLAQPNHLATLLVWGLIAIWWAHRRRQANGGLCTAAAAMLLFGVAMTQSRTGAVEVLLLGAAALIWRRTLSPRQGPAILALLGLWFGLAFLSWAPLNEALQQVPVLTMKQRLAADVRLVHWQLLLEAVTQRPWGGWGWNQVVLAQVELASVYPATYEVVQYGHNVGLDLVLWSGLPIAILLGGGVLVWIGRRVRFAKNAEQQLLLLAVAVLFVHALLELPHGYALFMLPAGLMVGTLHAAASGSTRLALPRPAMAMIFGALALCLMIVLRDYLLIEEAWTQQRMRAARIATPAAPSSGEVTTLTQLGYVLKFMRIEPRPSMPDSQLVEMRQVAHRFPSAPNLFRYAQAAALNGKADEAGEALVLLCKMSPPTSCTLAGLAWQELAQTRYPAMRAVLWPAVP